MKKEIVKKEFKNEVSTVDESGFDNVGPSQDITANDIMIPRILNMQLGSPKVVEGVAEFGELRDNLEWELLAAAKKGDTPAKTLEMIPFHWEKYWIIKKLNGQKYEFETMIKMDRSNQDLDPFEEWVGEDKVKRKRMYLHLFYVLIKGKSIPYTLGFRGGSKKAGDALVTQMYTINKQLKNVPAYTSSPMGKVIEVTPVKLSKDGNNFMAMEIKPLRDSTKEEAIEALIWNKHVSSGKAKVDLTDDDEIVRDTGEF